MSKRGKKLGHETLYTHVIKGVIEIKVVSQANDTAIAKAHVHAMNLNERYKYLNIELDEPSVTVIPEKKP